MKKQSFKYGIGAFIALAAVVIGGVSSAAAPKYIGGVSASTFCTTYAKDVTSKSVATSIVLQIKNNPDKKGQLIRQYIAFKNLGKQYCVWVALPAVVATWSVLTGAQNTGTVFFSNGSSNAPANGGGTITSNDTWFTSSDDYFVATPAPSLGGLTTEQATTTISRIDRAKELYASVVDEFVSKGWLNSADRDTMVGKVWFQLSNNCSELDGKILVRQWYDSHHNPIRNELVSLSITINLCFQPSYDAGYDTFLKKIIYHELGHYINYFHDTADAGFKNLCRSGTTSTCASSDFVNSYAASAPDEDYAESFSYYAQNSNAFTTTTLQQKLNYFQTAFPR